MDREGWVIEDSEEGETGEADYVGEELLDSRETVTGLQWVVDVWESGTDGERAYLVSLERDYEVWWREADGWKYEGRYYTERAE